MPTLSVTDSITVAETLTAKVAFLAIDVSDSATVAETSTLIFRQLFISASDAITVAETRTLFGVSGDLITIDDNGTLTYQADGGSEVFGLTAVNDVIAKITAGAHFEALTVEPVVSGTPEGRVEQSTTLWWRFSLATDASLEWATIENPATTPTFSSAGEGCVGPAFAPASEGCVAASSASSLEGCATGVATAPGRG